MAEIPGWIWLLVGAFVVGVSAYVGKLQFFVFMGFLFIAWGVFKIARDYMLGPERPRKRPWERDVAQMGRTPGVSGMGGLHPMDEAPDGVPPRSSTGAHSVRAVPCPTCKTHVWSTAHFCHFCGMRLRHPGSGQGSQ